MPASFKIGIVPGFRLRLRSLDRFRRFDCDSGPQFSAANSRQQVLPLGPMFSATRNVEITQRSICCRLFRRAPNLTGIPGAIGRDEPNLSCSLACRCASRCRTIFWTSVNFSIKAARFICRVASRFRQLCKACPRGRFCTPFNLRELQNRRISL